MNLFKAKKIETPYSMEDMLTKTGESQDAIQNLISMGILKPAKSSNGAFHFAELDIEKVKLLHLIKENKETISNADDESFNQLIQELEKISMIYKKSA